MRQKFFNLRVKLLEHDMTQEEAAKIAGISPSAMVNRMSGRYDRSCRLRTALAGA